ncbi:MAG: S9 family peptidase [Ignavibacteriae bacterium]|nr:S9 family peptidase [Ignavibacteriota bacterium]
MNTLKKNIVLIILLHSLTFAQEIPISDLLYPVNDYEFSISGSGKYMASVRKRSTGYSIFITDIEQGKLKSDIPLEKYPILNLNWISENRLSYEQMGVLYAINADGTEKEQLMSIWKKEKQYYFSERSLLNNIQTSKMVNVLKDDFENILIETRGIDDFPVIYKLNIYTGEKVEVENGNDYKINQWLVDKKGIVRLGIQNDDGKIKFFTKNNKKWESKNTINLDMDGNSFINKKLNFLDFDYDENIVFFSSSIDNPRWRILSFDINKKEYIDTILEDSKYDIGNPIHNDTKLLFLDSEQKLIGIRYERDKPYTEWFSEKFKAYQDTLKSHYPEYFADIFDWNNDASIILVKIYSDVDPGHILIFNTIQNKKLLFCSFAKDLLKHKVSYTKTINYQTRDGYRIEGYLNLPITNDKNIPFVILPHGGPFVRDYWGYLPEVQFFTNQGYGVLRMNFRGSTGYGVDHLLAGVKKISTTMVDDIADGAKWLIQENYSDSNNIFIYGHSYGGYAAIESIIQYPDLYNAAVSVASPTDIVSIIDYFDDLDNEFNYEFWKTAVGDPSDEDEFLKSISPINNIEKIKRPIYFFHGEKDETIPVSQTEEFIEEAEEIGKKFGFSIIKDEDHSISENRNVEFILKKSIQFFKENKR